MNDRAQAIEILQQARDQLAQQLTERVLEAREEIVDDAMGHSYMGEIEAIYDQFGNRLAHLGAMIAGLPPILETPILETSPPAATGENLDESDLLARLSAAPHPSLAIPPSALRPHEAPADEAITFQTFATQIRTGDLDGATRSLGALLGVDESRARLCAETFYEKTSANPEVMFKAMKLRIELLRGSVNGSLMLLWECFGLQGPEAIQVMTTLRAQAGATV